MVVLYVLVGVWLVSIAALAVYLFWPSSCSHIVLDDDPWLAEVEPTIRVSDYVTIKTTLIRAPDPASFQNGLIFAPLVKEPFAVVRNQGI